MSCWDSLGQSSNPSGFPSVRVLIHRVFFALWQEQGQILEVLAGSGTFRLVSSHNAPTMPTFARPPDSDVGNLLPALQVAQPDPQPPATAVGDTLIAPYQLAVEPKADDPSGLTLFRFNMELGQDKQRWV